MHRFIWLLFIVLFMSFNYMSAQFLSGKNAQILVKGFVKEAETGEYLAVDIEFRTEDKKKIKTKSNLLDGSFEQLLPAGEKFIVILNSDDILRKEFSFTTDEASEYKEQKTEWTAVKPKEGSKVFTGDIFASGKQNLKPEAQNTLKELQMLMRFNRGIHVDFLVSGEKNIVEKRKVELSKIIACWIREKERINVITGSNSDKNSDLTVKIRKVEDFLSR